MMWDVTSESALKTRCTVNLFWYYCRPMSSADGLVRLRLDEYDSGVSEIGAKVRTVEEIGQTYCVA